MVTRESRTAERGSTASEPPLHELLLRQTRWEADGVLSLLLETTGEPLPAWTPGAHVDVLLAPGLERQYSLCGDPADRRRWRIAVLREPASRGGSEHVHTQLRPGQTLSVRGPRNQFELVDAPHYEFVAGGIGITPIIPMVRAADAAGASWRLLYGGRSRASMAFADELAALGDRVTLQPEDELGRLDLVERLAQLPSDGVVYCCGPEGLIAAIEQVCSGERAHALHVERFRPVLDEQEMRAGGAFELVLERSGATLVVQEGQTIVEALEAAGMDAPHSCLEGVCGTCETRVIAGEPDHRDAILTEDERAANDTMMICVGRSKSARLVLDL